jgi:hypothetical protein
MSEPINPNPVISPPHTSRRSLLLCVRLHHVLHVRLHASASLLLHVEVLRNRVVYPAFTVVLENHVICPAFTVAPGNLRRDHAAASPTASTVVTVTAAPVNRCRDHAPPPLSGPSRQPPPTAVQQTISLSLSLSLCKFRFAVFGCLPI